MKFDFETRLQRLGDQGVPNEIETTDTSFFKKCPCL